ncbi:helix-turn-helix domain-containing protein [Nocardia sp. 2]|uniref:Helix-turn-helix domain-containing protein n=1 Tax=Nocardia acididurans TaxID=2802282 RepID=A0ABS1MEM2_9NOCA|nr:helix-turn-helix domain-containing protein [Nocardia acididurans]MBL1079019.1 helix-turn-helix domain-containing protein [Nocardia acididurans]
MATPALLLGGRPLADQLAQRTSGLVADTVARVRAEVTFYGSLPEEAIRRDVTRVVRRNLELFIGTLRTETLPDAGEFDALEKSARERAEERVPLADVLGAYHVGSRVWWRVVGGLAGPGDEAAVARAGALLQQYIQLATAAVLAGYGADQAPPPAADHARTTVFHALATGVEIADTARAFGISLAPRYWVLVIRLGVHPDERDPEVATTVAARRKARRLEFELDRIGKGDTLCTVTSGGGVAFIPLHAHAVDATEIGPDPADTAPIDTAAVETAFAALEKQLRDIGRVVGVSSRCAVDLATPDRIPETLSEVRELLEVAARYRPGEPVVRFRDLGLEYQLTRPSRVTRLNAAVLAPLTDPVLRHTLETYLACDANSGATATRLHIHPNTVLYRLRKAADLTGLELGKPRDVVRIMAALAATRSGETLPPPTDFD